MAMNYNGKGGLTYNLSSMLKAGGEGEIYDITGKSNLVAKIYKTGKANLEKENKLIKMINDPPDKLTKDQIAWPQDVLYSTGKFVGFTMPKLEVNEDLNVIYEYGSSAKYRNMTWENRIIIAENLCTVLQAIHYHNHVCGDLNPKNISVNPNTGIVVFLDTDSYHIQDGNITYRCDVGIPEYLPAEVQRKMRGGNTLATVNPSPFSKDTDNFALAIHIFQLLMNGAHPFACAVTASHSSVTAPQPNDNIEKGLFPYMQQVTGLERPAYAPEINILPENMQNLFGQAFISGHNSPNARPRPESWRVALSGLRRNLKNCGKVAFHQYCKNLSSCPWCKTDKAYDKVLNRANYLPQQTIIRPIVLPPKPSVTTPRYGSTTKTKSSKPVIIIGAIAIGIVLLIMNLSNREPSPPLPPPPPQITVSGVTVNPSTATVTRGQSQQFSSSVSGTGNPPRNVNWSVEGRGSGSGTSISATGVLSVAANESATRLTVRATSTIDETKSGMATVTINAASTSTSTNTNQNPLNETTWDYIDGDTRYRVSFTSSNFTLMVMNRNGTAETEPRNNGTYSLRDNTLTLVYAGNQDITQRYRYERSRIVNSTNSNMVFTPRQ